MLPALNKSIERDLRPADAKIFNPPRQLSQERPKREIVNESSRHSVKGKIGGGGFRLAHEEVRNDSLRVHEYVQQSAKIASSNFRQKINSSQLNQEIKLIEKKIRQCQKKIESEKKRKVEEERKAHQNRYQQDFQEVIRRQLQLQGQSHDPSKNFDYLTNPGGPPQEEEEPVEEPPAPEPQPSAYSIEEGIEKLERFYENSLKKKFERREIFPHQACRRKTPKLYITQKNNALSKHGKPLTEQQHKFRVLTKQTTPQQIYPVIPNFAVVKDSLSKNIVAYLGDYKPFLDKTKEKVDKQLRKDDEQQIVIENRTLTPAN